MTRQGEWIALAVAFIWSIGLLVAAAVVPVYSGTSETSPGGHERHHTGTLVEVNGSGVLLAVGVPLLATILVSFALLARGAYKGAGPIAWTLVGLLGAFNVLGMLTIGVFLVPITACLVVACALHGDSTSVTAG